MHLDGQGLLGVDELDEHREVLKGGGVFPQGLGELLKILAQRQAVPLPAGKSALPRRVGGSSQLSATLSKSQRLPYTSRSFVPPHR